MTWRRSIEIADRDRAIEAMTARIAELLSERSRDAMAFASPADRIANLEHELADLRESETTQGRCLALMHLERAEALAEIIRLRRALEIEDAT